MGSEKSWELLIFRRGSDWRWWTVKWIDYWKTRIFYRPFSGWDMPSVSRAQSEPGTRPTHSRPYLKASNVISCFKLRVMSQSRVLTSIENRASKLTESRVLTPIEGRASTVTECFFSTSLKLVSIWRSCLNTNWGTRSHIQKVRPYFCNQFDSTLAKEIRQLYQFNSAPTNKPKLMTSAKLSF